MALRKNVVVTRHGISAAKTLKLSARCEAMLARMESVAGGKKKTPLTEEQEQFLLMTWSHKKRASIVDAFKKLWSLDVKVDWLRLRYLDAQKKYGIK